MTESFIEDDNIIRKSLKSEIISESEFLAMKDFGKKLVFISTDLDSTNNPKELIYYISGLERISNYIKSNRDFSIQSFILTLQKICKSFLQCTTNKNLDTNRILLNVENIFIDTLSHSIRLMYLPYETKNELDAESKLRLVLLRLIDIYCISNRITSNILSHLREELTIRFVDMYILIENLNKMITRIEENK